MFRRSVLRVGLLGLSLASVALPISAHQVKVANDVGGTLHIEPNDTAKAGEPAEVWFALTRQGGQAISLADCDCQLAVYAQPYQEGSTPLIRPPLKPISAEGYQNIPGAEIVFPKVGAYTLIIEGQANQPDAFQPFQLPFDVTVAAAAKPAAQPEPAADSTGNSAPTEVLGVESKALPPVAAPLWQPSIIAASIALLAGLVWSLRHRLKDDDPDPPS